MGDSWLAMEARLRLRTKYHTSGCLNNRLPLFWLSGYSKMFLCVFSSMRCCLCFCQSIIMRFASLNAHHDSGIKGINTEIAQRLVDILKPHGRIYITSERPLEPQFEEYRIKINPLDMHHVMAFASLYIGDSQTMAAEAGVLGVPFVRFNDFVGRIGYLRELEDKYELGYGIKASAPGSVDQFCSRVEELVSMPSAERKAVFQERRQTMLSDKIDCAKFLTWFIENYPQSAEQTRKADAGFWARFK